MKHKLFWQSFCCEAGKGEKVRVRQESLVFFVRA